MNEMTMTFDDAYDEIERITDDLNIRQSVINDLLSVIQKLRNEHMPTIEMTKQQKETLIRMKHDKQPISLIFPDVYYSEIVSSFDKFWDPLTEEQLMRAWLYPETIKVVG